MNILFFVLKTKLLKNGEAPILMRITINGQYEETRIQRSISLKLWNAAKGCSKGKDRLSSELNNYIAELNARVLEKHKELMLEQALITPKLLLKRTFGKDTEMRTLLGTMQQEIGEMEKVINMDYSPITINRYKNVLNKLQKAILKFYEKEDITFHELSPEFIKAFDIYLKTEAGLCRNTVVRYMKCLKKITNMGLAKEWMRKDPFYGYKMQQDETDPTFLTYEELQTIMNKEFTIPRLALVKDIFIFALYTGLAFIDVYNLRPEHVSEDSNGNLWIVKPREKTNNLCNIPLLSIPKQILEKYKDNPYCMDKGTLLPVPCNQKMNSYLKEIADLCGIKKNLTTHTARHSFASVIALANNVSLPNVAKMLGHSSTRMTQHYAKVLDQTILRDMQYVERKISFFSNFNAEL
jgi:site-specific recombinase XerD